MMEYLSYPLPNTMFCSVRFLSADITQVLCELELTIKRVKVSTAPDGKVMDLFFVTDTRSASFVSLFYNLLGYCFLLSVSLS